MAKMDFIYPLVIRRNEARTHPATCMNSEILAKQSDTKDHMLYDAIDMKCPEEADPQDEYC